MLDFKISLGFAIWLVVLIPLVVIWVWERATARFRVPKPLPPNLAVVAELRRCFLDLKLIEAPHIRMQERWRQAFIALSDPLFKPKEAAARLAELGFGADQVELLLDWRSTRPQVLITLLLLLVTGQPDDDVWSLAEKQRGQSRSRAPRRRA